MRSNGEGIVVVFPFSMTYRGKSRKNQQWSEVVMSLNPVIPHLKMVVSITIGHNRKSILSDPIRNDFESQVFLCFWSNGSNSLHSLHIIAMPSDALMKGTLPSITNTI